MPTTGGAAANDATANDIEVRIAGLAQRTQLGFAPGARWRIQHARPTDLAAGELTLFDVLEQARAARRLLTTARGVVPQDLSPPSRTSTAVIDLVDLEQRVTITGQYSGRNLTGDLPDAPARSRYDFVLRSADAAIWVSDSAA